LGPRLLHRGHRVEPVGQRQRLAAVHARPQRTQLSRHEPQIGVGRRDSGGVHVGNDGPRLRRPRLRRLSLAPHSDVDRV